MILTLDFLSWTALLDTVNICVKQGHSWCAALSSGKGLVPWVGPVVLRADLFDQPEATQLQFAPHWGKTGAGAEAVRQDLKSDLLKVKGE